MKFTVVIPSFGQAQYLRQAIESALAQSYDKPYEIIVVDDGSTDGSYEIARDYVPRVKVIRQTNRGLASARNTGIMNAKGEWIVPLDADDIMYPDALREMDTRAQPLFVDAVVPSIRCFDETGNENDTILIPEPQFDDFKEGNRLAYFAAIRRDKLLEIGGYSPKMDALGGWEDLHLWYNLMASNTPYRKPFVTIPYPLLKYRVKDKSMWKEAEKNKAALWAQIIKDFPDAKSHAKS